jgi:MFS family permease
MVVDAGTIYTSINNALQAITPANVTNPIEFWLAFLLVLAILNTVLKNISFFKGQENKTSRGIVALIISFFAVTAAWVSPVLLYMSSTLAVTAIILVAILIVASLAGYDKKLQEGKGAQWLFIGAIIVLFAGGLFSYAVVPAGSSGTSGAAASGVGSALSGVISSLGNSPGLIGLLIVLGGIVFLAIYLASSGSPISPSRL